MNKKRKMTIFIIIILVFIGGVTLLTRSLVLDSIDGNIIFDSSIIAEREAGVYIYSFKSKKMTQICIDGFNGLEKPTVQNGGEFVCSARQISDEKIYLIKIQNLKVVDKIGLEEYPSLVRACGDSVYFTYAQKLYKTDFINKKVDIVAKNLTSSYPYFSSLYSGYNKLIFARDSTAENVKYELWLYENGKESLICTAKYCGGFVSENEVIICDDGIMKRINIYSYTEKTIRKTDYIFPYLICNGKFMIATTVDTHLADSVYLVHCKTDFKSLLLQFSIYGTNCEWYQDKEN